MEWLHNKCPKTFLDANNILTKIIDLYNNERPHQSLDYQAPSLIHEIGMKTIRRWKTYYRRMANFNTDSQAISGQN